MWHVFQDITRNMWHVFHEGGYITYIWLALDVMSQVYSNRTRKQTRRSWRREEVAQATATNQHGCAIRTCYKTKAKPIRIINNLQSNRSIYQIQRNGAPSPQAVDRGYTSLELTQHLDRSRHLQSSSPRPVVLGDSRVGRRCEYNELYSAGVGKNYDMRLKQEGLLV